MHNMHTLCILVSVTIIIFKFMSGDKCLRDRYTHHHTCSCHHMCTDLQPHMDNKDPCSHQDTYMTDHKYSQLEKTNNSSLTSREYTIANMQLGLLLRRIKAYNIITTNGPGRWQCLPVGRISLEIIITTTVITSFKPGFTQLNFMHGK